MLELYLQYRRRQKDKRRQNDKKDRIIKNGRTEGEGQKEIYYVYMILLLLRINCNVEIYSNYATSCCTIDLSSNLSYGLQYSMVLTTSNLLSFLRISILLSLLSPKDTR